MKNHSHDDSILSSFANLKEKLEEFENKGGASLKIKELSSSDLQSILYWYTKAFGDSDEIPDNHKNTLIKIQALAIYAKEDEDWTDKFFKRRMR